MFSFRKTKKTIHLMIEDYVIRIIETNGNALSSANLFAERAIPLGFIQNGKIIDEIGFYDFMKELVDEIGLKNRKTKFIVPNALVIMRHIDIPATLVEKKDIIAHIGMEFGNSIHLPFSDPVFDITHLQAIAENEDLQQVTLFAVPGEEVRKYTEIFADVSLKPIVADVGILGDYRYFHHVHQVQHDHAYLIVEFNRTSIYLGIFHDNQLEFLRYQDLDIELKGHSVNVETDEITWEFIDDIEVVQQLIRNQVNELENIMNFYRFSLNKGERAVTDIVVLGDYPNLHMVYNNIIQQYEIPTILLENQTLEEINQSVDSAFIPLLGLALNGGTVDAS